MKAVLVTGGNGFIGSHVVDCLLSEGYEPLIFDRRYRGEEHVFLGDITDDVAVTEAMAHSDAFIHLAAVLGTQETINNPRPAAITNVMGGLNVLEAAAQYKVPGVYIGVGNHWMNNTYSISKTTVERFIHMFNADRGTQINIVRVVNAYGPRQVAAAPYGPGKVRKITPSFVCRALNNHPIEIYGDGEQVSDMVYVQDAAKTLVRAMQMAAAGDVRNHAIECGPAESNTVNEVAELIVALSNSASVINHLAMRPGEIPGAEVRADVSTLAGVVDVDDFTSLEDGMRKTIEYFEHQDIYRDIP